VADRTGSFGVVVRVLDHVVAGGNLGLLESSLENVYVCVVFELHVVNY